MDTGAISRFLELVARELRADDVYVRIGGAPKATANTAHVEVAAMAWVIAEFKSPILHREKVSERLEALCSSFRSTVESALSNVPFTGNASQLVRQRLDQELGGLAERAGAVRAAVFDFDSPVIWGASPALGEGAEEANQRLERAVTELRERRASELRRHHGQTLRFALDVGGEVLARPFASLYVLALLFEGPISEPIALGAILHSMHLIERLVLALPPIDPEPGAKIIRLFK